MTSVRPAECTPLYDFTEVKWGAMLARAVGYKRGEGGAALADYLEAFSYAIEAIHASRQLYDGDLRDLRAAVLDRLATMGFIAAADDLGVNAYQCVQALVHEHAHPMARWTESDWTRFERYIHSRTVHSVKDVRVTFGIGNALAETLIHAYGRETLTDYRQRLTARLFALRDERPTATGTTLHRLLVAEGFDVGASTVSKLLAERRASGARAA